MERQASDCLHVRHVGIVVVPTSAFCVRCCWRGVHRRLRGRRLAGCRNAGRWCGRRGGRPGRALGLFANRVAAITATVASASLRYVDVAVAAAAIVVVDAVVAYPGKVVAGSAEGYVAGEVLSVTRVVRLEPVEGGAGAGC